MTTIVNKGIKSPIFISILYTLIMGIGMYISFYGYGISYLNPKLVEILWIVELLLSLLSIVLVFKYFSWKQIGFTKVKLKGLFWFLPSLVLLSVMVFRFFVFIQEQSVSIVQWKLLALVGCTTLLVGFSEEIIYRGVVLKLFLKKKGLFNSIFISAFLFSLMHVVNFLAGLDIKSLILQLILTFILGIFFGVLKIKMVAIWPLIIFHWLWDFLLISGSIFHFEGNALISLLFVIHEIIIIFFLYFFYRKDSKIFLT